jgi:hypothetical protein
MRRRASYGKAPPTWIGGCGFCTGLGLAIIGSKLTNSPLVFGLGFGPDFLHRLDGLAHPLEAGCLDGAVVFISSWFQPPPTPNRNRPRLTWSIEATSLAVWIASRCCTSSTPVPSFMVLSATTPMPQGLDRIRFRAVRGDLRCSIGVKVRFCARPCGYTDNRPVGPALERQGITSNQDLSQKRAENVMEFIISQGGRRRERTCPGNPHPALDSDPAGSPCRTGSAMRHGCDRAGDRRGGAAAPRAPAAARAAPQPPAQSVGDRTAARGTTGDHADQNRKPVRTSAKPPCFCLGRSRRGDLQEIRLSSPASASDRRGTPPEDVQTITAGLLVAGRYSCLAFPMPEHQ